MSEYRNKYLIYCDAYGTYVNKSECRKCILKKDCVKIKLPLFNTERFKIPKYS